MNSNQTKIYNECVKSVNEMPCGIAMHLHERYYRSITCFFHSSVLWQLIFVLELKSGLMDSNPKIRLSMHIFKIWIFVTIVNRQNA